MARLRWRVMFEMAWDDNLPAVAHGEIPRGLSGRDRTQFVKNRAAAQELLKSLFPPDEE